MHSLAERAEDLEDATDGLEISDRTASLLAAELSTLAGKLLEEATVPQKRWRRLQEILWELRHLRRHDHDGQRIPLQRERWEEESERLDQEKSERRIQKAKDRALTPLWARMMQGPLAEAFGGGEYGNKIARIVTAIQYDLPVDGLPGSGAPIIVNQPQSVTVTNGNPAVFTVVAQGSPTIYYRWYKNGNPLNDVGNISGSATATLTIANAGDADAGTYTVDVSGPAGQPALVSTPVTLTVLDALTITSQPKSLTERVGDSLAFAVGVTGTSPTYQWALIRGKGTSAPPSPAGVPTQRERANAALLSR